MSQHWHALSWVEEEVGGTVCQCRRGGGGGVGRAHRPDFSVSQVFPHTAHCTAGLMVCTGIYTGVGTIGRELEEEGMVVREVHHRWKQLSDLATADLSLLAAAWTELQYK